MFFFEEYRTGEHFVVGMMRNPCALYLSHAGWMPGKVFTSKGIKDGREKVGPGPPISADSVNKNPGRATGLSCPNQATKAANPPRGIYSPNNKSGLLLTRLFCQIGVEVESTPSLVSSCMHSVMKEAIDNQTC
eukprot:5784373-Amphidinium_carterae.1